jgi:glutaminyl-peptide cyclotransferase
MKKMRKKTSSSIYPALKYNFATKLSFVLVFLLLAFLTGVQAASNINEFDGQRAYQWLVKQTDLGPRNPGSSGHDAALALLKGELELRGAKTVLQPFMHYDAEKGITLTMSNIIGSFNPDNLSRIILCAHWDTRPFADRDTPANADKPILGANDGGSGVAVLMELARLMQASAPPVGVDIVLFDGEDYGKEGDLDNYCLGSRYFADNHAGFYPRFAILLDMIGDADLRIPVEGYSEQYAPDVVDLVWGEAERLGVYQFSREINGYIFDDHVVLNQGGIRAIDLIDFDYPAWHTLGDTADKCSPASLKAVGDVLNGVIYNMKP